MSSLLRRLPAAGGLGDRGDSTQPHSPWLDVPDGDPTHPACKSRALERKWKAMAEWSEGTGQEPNGGRSALSRTYLLNKSGTHTLASLLIFGGLGLGGACLNRTIRPGDPTGWNAGLPWLVALIAVTSAAGGALYHPIGRFWPEGVVGALVANAGGLGLLYACLVRNHAFRPLSRNVTLIVVLVGACPGLWVYLLLLRGQFVRPEEHAAFLATKRP